jgi:hypothetical protein
VVIWWKIRDLPEQIEPEPMAAEFASGSNGELIMRSARAITRPDVWAGYGHKKFSS